jgi:drug/metabolite transporter (DMT)-like permease
LRNATLGAGEADLTQSPLFQRCQGRLNVQLDAFEWTRTSAYFALILVVFLNAAANLMLKIGAVASAPNSLLLSLAGLFCFGLSAIPYWLALRNVDLNSAQIVVSCQYILVILAAGLILGEPISITKWSGIALIAIGLFVALG